MIVSHKHRFIFLKTTKTAGTSIEIALSEHCGPDDVITPISPEDESTRQSMGFRGPQNCKVPLARYRWKEIRKFLRERNRQKFFNHTTAAEAKQWVGQKIWVKYFVFCFERNPYDKAISRYFWSTREDRHQELQSYLETAPRWQLSNWHIYTIGNELAVDFVGRYEKLEADLNHVWKQLKLPGTPNLPRAKGTYRNDSRHYSRLLDRHSRALVSRICENEIAAFDYRFEVM